MYTHDEIPYMVHQRRRRKVFFENRRYFTVHIDTRSRPVYFYYRNVYYNPIARMGDDRIFRYYIVFNQFL